jgi:short-subunit dehydrogenase
MHHKQSTRKPNRFGDRELKTIQETELFGRLAVVTGASSGVGRAISLALARQGVRLCLIGRDAARLSQTTNEARLTSQATSFQLDLNQERSLRPLLSRLKAEGGVDILVHSAGVIHEGAMENAPMEDFDAQIGINVRAPYILTKRLLPLLSNAAGQVVFINSSAGLSAKRPDIGQYGATKHALKAIADSLREEVNERGIRVLTVYLGRTATPMQKALFKKRRVPYNPETLLQPADVASVVVHALALPRTAEVTDIHIRPMIRGGARNSRAIK